MSDKMTKAIDQSQDGVTNGVVVKSGSVGVSSLPLSQDAGPAGPTTLRAVISDDSLGMAEATATGTIALSGAGPADADTITLDDGVNSATVFEFDAGVAAAGSVTIAAGRPSAGDTVDVHGVTFEFTNGGGATGDNVEVDMTGNTTNEHDGADLLTAIKANIAGLNHATTTGALVETSYVITLTWNVVGTAGNATVTVSGANLSKTDMAGGLAAGDDVTGGRVGVAIGATNAITMASLVARINGAAGLDISASPTVPAGASCTLANDIPGAAGNVAITKSGATIAVTGMTGGLDTVSLRTLQASIDAMTTQIAALVVVLTPA